MVVRIGSVPKQIPKVTIQAELCGYCGACVAVCPRNAIVLLDVVLRIDDEKCEGCLDCLRICPLQALETTDDAGTV